MPADASAIGEIVKTAMDEMPRHHPPIQRGLVLRTLAIDETPLNHRSLVCVQIGAVEGGEVGPGAGVGRRRRGGRRRRVDGMTGSRDAAVAVVVVGGGGGAVSAVLWFLAARHAAARGGGGGGGRRRGRERRVGSFPSC